MIALEIIDEAGNPHGPFATKDEAIEYAADRGLGEPKLDPDDDRAPGWTWRAAGFRNAMQSASIREE